MAKLGEDYRCVGFPTNSGFGGFTDCGFCLTVSVRAEDEKRDIISDFLQYLLSARAQRDIGIRSVRKDVLCSYVRERMELSKERMLWYGGSGYPELATKSDGSTYLAEYMEILEKGDPLPPWDPDIGGIILEEAEFYFQGDKTAKQAANIIQNRVQLYLDEQK